MQSTYVAAVVGAAALAIVALFVKHHRFSIGELSAWHWRRVRRAFDALRARFFTVDGSEPDLIVDAPIEEVRRALGEQHFTNAWELSYRYRGEDLNMRRPVYVAGTHPWRQDHARGWDRGDGTSALDVHRELEPTAYPAKHLDQVAMETEPAIGVLIGVLEGAGYDVRKSKDSA